MTTFFIKLIIGLQEVTDCLDLMTDCLGLMKEIYDKHSIQQNGTQVHSP